MFLSFSLFVCIFSSSFSGRRVWEGNPKRPTFRFISCSVWFSLCISFSLFFSVSLSFFYFSSIVPYFSFLCRALCLWISLRAEDNRCWEAIRKTDEKNSENWKICQRTPYLENTDCWMPSRATRVSFPDRNIPWPAAVPIKYPIWNTEKSMSLN